MVMFDWFRTVYAFVFIIFSTCSLWYTLAISTIMVFNIVFDFNLRFCTI